MTKIHINDHLVIAGQEYKAGDHVEVANTLVHREVQKVNPTLQAMLDSGILTVNGDLYTVAKNAVVNVAGGTYSQGQTFTAHKIYEYEDVMDVPEWIAAGVAKGIFKIELGVIHVTGVSVDGTVSLAVGATQKLVPVFTPANATDKTGTWKTSASTIVAVAADGTITAKKAGTAKITFTSTDGQFSAVCNVTVTAPPAP